MHVIYGYWSAGLPNGLFNAQLANGSHFIGDMIHSYGKGKLTFPDGVVYNGGIAWKDANKVIIVPYGHGIINFVSGSIYEGGMDNCRAGFGIMKFPDGASHEGTWVNDIMVAGKGIFKYVVNGKYTAAYQGGIYKGERDGYGTLTHANGEIHSGNWKNDDTIGNCTIVYPGGSIYEGTLLEGQRDGHGKYIHTTGWRYEGCWKHDLREGYGLDRDKKGNLYKGHWKNNMRHGYGIFTTATGVIYEGDWNLDALSGSVIIKYSTGVIFEGNYDDFVEKKYGSFKLLNGSTLVGIGKTFEQHSGIIYYPNGQVYRGECMGGHRHGKGVMYYYNNDMYKGTWMNNIGINDWKTVTKLKHKLKHVDENWGNKWKHVVKIKGKVQHISVFDNVALISC